MKIDISETKSTAGSMSRSVSVLGSTGSIGCSTLDLISRNREKFSVVTLTGNHNIQLLAEQALTFRPKLVVVADEAGYKELKAELSGSKIEVAAGNKALTEAANLDSDIVMAGIVGIAGLEPTMAAVKRGVTVALANKESLVCAGTILINELEKSGGQIIPVDSEHNAIFQVFDFRQHEAVDKLILTASGGPFRETPVDQMDKITPKEALAHPNWVMGEKISVDSATMMNKGLELIEAFYLFPINKDQIDILIHPQSILHSMVAYKDGSVLAQLGSPDMRTPISFALAWPKRMETPAPRLDLDQIMNLTFQVPDTERFPAIRIAKDALSAGGAAPIVLNAANEIAVKHFLQRQIGYLDIVRIVGKTLNSHSFDTPSDINDISEIDKEARKIAEDLVNSVTSAM